MYAMMEWTNAQQLLLSPEMQRGSSSADWILLQRMEEMAEEAMRKAEALFGTWERTALDMIVLDSPDWGETVKLEARFRSSGKKTGQLRINSYVQDGRKARRCARVNYDLRSAGKA